jgi:hypothetical protein
MLINRTARSLKFCHWPQGLSAICGGVCLLSRALSTLTASDQRERGRCIKASVFHHQFKATSPVMNRAIASDPISIPSSIIIAPRPVLPDSSAFQCVPICHRLRPTALCLGVEVIHDQR